MLANAVHVAVALFWVGALAHLLIGLWRVRTAPPRALLAKAASRYATLALLPMPPLLVAGAITALDRFSEPAELVSSGYGRILLVKLGAASVALVLAVAARLRAIRVAPPRLGLLRRLAGAEGLVLLGVLGLSAALASAAPPRSVVLAQADLLGPPPLDGPVVRLDALTGQLAVFLAASDGELELRVLTPDGDPASDARVQLQGRDPAGEALELYPRSCGRGCFSLSFSWQAGTTQLILDLTDSDWPGGSTNFSVPWPPSPDKSALLDRAIQTMREQEHGTMLERVSSGPGMTGGDHVIPLAGAQFVELEPYGGGGATDVRELGSDGGDRVLTFFLPGSALWFRLELDSQDRLSKETIVDAGHLIERSFSYDAAPG